MTASILVPYRSDNGLRDQSWNWLRRRWLTLCPDMELIEESDGKSTIDPVDFNHPRAINKAAARASEDVLIIADCDTVFDVDWLRTAIDLVRRGEAPWVMPRLYDKLTAEESQTVLRSPVDSTVSGYTPEWRGDSICWSGIVVVPRTGFDVVGGYDERFDKWGADDTSFGLSMNTLWGAHARLGGAVQHLWHEANLQALYGHSDQRAQQELAQRYCDADGDETMMRAVRYGT